MGLQRLGDELLVADVEGGAPGVGEGQVLADESPDLELPPQAATGLV